MLLLLQNMLYAEPKRADGLSVHWMHKRVSNQDETGQVRSGFMVSQSRSLIPPLERSVFGSVEELVDYYHNLPEKIQENGIWIVVTHPDAYSDEEKKMKVNLIELCNQNNIPLFICRGQDLPDGWKAVTSIAIASMGGVNKGKEAVDLGWRYLREGNSQMALRYFNKAILLDKKFAPAYFGIAYVHSVNNDLDLAIKNYKKSIELEPGYSHSYSNLGLALLYSGKPKEAYKMIRKALKIDPDNGDAHVNMAVFYFSIENYKKAWEYIHIAQSFNAEINRNFLKDLQEKYPEDKK